MWGRVDQDLREKKSFREKLGVRDEWLMPFETIPIIRIPEYGTESAKVACQLHKVASQNDREKLDKAKEDVYTKGYYAGVMIVGEHEGKRVCEVCNAEQARNALALECPPSCRSVLVCTLTGARWGCAWWLTG